MDLLNWQDSFHLDSSEPESTAAPRPHLPRPSAGGAVLRCQGRQVGR